MAIENLTLAPFYSDSRNPFNYAKIEQINRDVVTSWLTLEQITQQINLFDDESQDKYLESLEVAVRMFVEDYLGASFMTTQYRTYYANPGQTGTPIYLDLPEASPGSAGVTINSVSYWIGDTTATKVNLPKTGYYYDPTGNRVVVNSMPSPLSQNVANPVQCEFTVNAALVAQYPVVQQAGLLLFTHWYNNRADTVQKRMTNIPLGFEAMLRPYKPLIM